jgi:hypothetical protein
MTRAADMARSDHRARGLELLDVAEEALQSRDHEWAGACALLATAHFEAARRYRADADTPQ